MTEKDENKIFKEAMKGITPLKSSNRIVHASNKKNIKKRTKPHPDDTTPQTLKPYIAHQPDVTAECILSYQKPGLDPKLLKQLTSGKNAIQLTIDLHGETEASAEQTLIEAWQHAEAQALRHLLIIHGKGKQSVGNTAILKSLVNRFLLSMPNVLAFCSAKPQDGGTGAVYVLLKRKRGD